VRKPRRYATVAANTARIPVHLWTALSTVDDAGGSRFSIHLRTVRGRGQAWIRSLGRKLPEGADAPGDVRESISRRVGRTERRSRAGCVGSAAKFQVFAINCAHWAAPCDGSPVAPVHVPCHGGAYYEDGSRASGPRPVGFSSNEYEIGRGSSGSAAASFRRWPDGVIVKITGPLRSVAGWLEARTGSPAGHAAVTHPVPRRTASWWYVFARDAHALRAPDRHRIACARVRPGGGPGVSESSVPERAGGVRRVSRAVHFWARTHGARDELHMLRCSSSAPTSFARADVDRRCPALLCTLGMAFTGKS